MLSNYFFLVIWFNVVCVLNIYICFSRSLSEPLMTYSLHEELILAASMTEMHPARHTNPHVHRYKLIGVNFYVIYMYLTSVILVCLVQHKHSSKRGKTHVQVHCLLFQHCTKKHLSDSQSFCFVNPIKHVLYIWMTLVKE